MHGRAYGKAFRAARSGERAVCSCWGVDGVIGTRLAAEISLARLRPICWKCAKAA